MPAEQVKFILNALCNTHFMFQAGNTNRAKHSKEKSGKNSVKIMDNCKLKVTVKYHRNNSTDLLNKTCLLITHFSKVFSAIFSSEQLCRISASNYLQAGCWLCHNT